MRQRPTLSLSLALLLLLGTAGAALGAPQTSPATPPSAPFHIQPPAPAVAPPAVHHDPADDVRRISVEDAYKAFRDGTATVVDVRGREDFAAQHVTGALNLPVFEIVAHAGELSKDKLIITYCT